MLGMRKVNVNIVGYFTRASVVSDIIKASVIAILITMGLQSNAAELPTGLVTSAFISRQISTEVTPYRAGDLVRRAYTPITAKTKRKAGVVPVDTVCGRKWYKNYYYVGGQVVYCKKIDVIKVRISTGQCYWFTFKSFKNLPLNQWTNIQNLPVGKMRTC